jgi:hypothetical protein
MYATYLLPCPDQRAMLTLNAQLPDTAQLECSMLPADLDNSPLHNVLVLP